MASKLKQFAKFKKDKKQADKFFDQQLLINLQDRFFEKHVPKYQLWLMKRSKWFTKKMSYQLAIIDNDPNKLMLYREIDGKNKVIAKSF